MIQILTGVFIYMPDYLHSIIDFSIDLLYLLNKGCNSILFNILVSFNVVEIVKRISNLIYQV